MEEQTVKKETKRRGKLPGWLKIMIAVIVTLGVSLGGICLLLGRDGVALMEGWLLAKYAFVDTEADLSQAADRALSGLVSGLGDRWSYYLDEESYQRVTENRANRYVGVGVTVSYEREEGLLVQAVTGGGPAGGAGIVPGDVIVAVDGVSIAGEARNTATELVAGEEGTQVELTLLGADGGKRTVTCIRTRLQNPSATGKMLEGSIGYVRLANFYSGAADSVRTVVDGLLAQGAESLIIDLRNDPGGYISELEEILDYLLPEGVVLTQKPRWWFGVESRSDAACVEVPMVAMVNGETYSAAELLAAQLRESVGAPIVGEVTSGKGYSQITFPLFNGGGLGLSTATYCTGSGHSLIGEGIIPDVELALEEESDNQLQAAIDLLS